MYTKQYKLTRKVTGTKNIKTVQRTVESRLWGQAGVNPDRSGQTELRTRL